MNKKVLLADKSESVREQAKAILSQNGLDVICVGDGDKFLEILNFGRPHLLIIGADLTGKGDRPVWEIVQEDRSMSAIPILFLAAEDDRSLPFPDEVIIPRQFDPGDFIERVLIFVGQAAGKKEEEVANPFGAADVEDEFLNAALGLDQIHVTDSEVMDKTQTTAGKKQKSPHRELVGADESEVEHEDHNDSRKVESLMISEDQTDIRRPKTEKSQARNQTSTGQLEILPDQYGLTEPHGEESEFGGREHDYDWFINEMQKEHRAGEKPSSKKALQPQPASLHIEETSSMVDPETRVQPKPVRGQDKSEGVERYIDEFRREIEKFHTDESDKVDLKKPASPRASDSKWKESIERVTADDVELFTRQFASELADKVAAKIVDKIDRGKLLSFIKSELAARV